MSKPIRSVYDFGNANRIINLAAAVAAGQPVTFEQLQAAIEGISWKDNVRVAAQVNTTISSPGATVNGVTMVANDRVLLFNQTAQTENGIYVWNGAAVPMTRALDASTFDELENAFVSVDEGTSAGATFRQTQVNGVIGTNNVIFASAFTGSPAATETTAGIAEIATQAETDGGTDDLRFITALKLASWAGRAKRFSGTFGDGTTTSIVVTHNLNTEDVEVYVREVGGSKRQIGVEVQHTSVNSVTLLFDTGAAPALNSIRCTVLA